MFELFMLLFIIGIAYLAWLLLVAIWPYLLAAVAVIIILNVWANSRQNRKSAPKYYQRPRPVPQPKPPLPPTEKSTLQREKLAWVRHPNPTLPTTAKNNEAVPGKPVEGTTPPVTQEECVTCFSCNLNIPIPANSNTGWVQCPSCRDMWLTPVGRKSFEDGRIAFEDHAKLTTEITAQEFDEQSGEAESGKKRRRKKRGKWAWYGDYLESWTWKRKRGQALKRDRRKCVHCGKPANQVHHTKYAEKLGTEPIEWLESVCTDCHRRLHGSSEEDWRRRVIPKSRYFRR